MAKKKIKVLFFIAGTVATAEENAAMEEFSAKHLVCVRNASMIGDNEAIEPFDLVAGAVPPRYAEVAASKPPVEERERPKAPAASAPVDGPITPLAPPQGGADDGKDDGKDDDSGKAPQEAGNAPQGAPAAPATDNQPVAAPAAPQAASKPAKAPAPKAPEAKPDAAKGWKPNA